MILGFETISIIVLAIWLIITNLVLFQVVHRYGRLTKGIKKKELRELLENSYSKLKDQEKTNKELITWIEKLKKDQESDLQKIGFVRFNPFVDTGGNQSFCLAILDRLDNGIVISSLHSRDQTRLYAKALKQGKSGSQQLSKEENQAIQKAQKG